MSRFKWSDIKDAVFPASGSTRAIINSGSGKLDTYGTVVPADGTAGFAKGCKFTDTAYGKVYVNEGTNTSCEFKELLAVPRYAETAADRGPSPLIWDNCPILDYEHNPVKGMHYFTDFSDGIVVASNQSTAAAAALGTTGDWAGFTANGPTISTLTTNYKGVVRLFATADNLDAIIAYPKTAQTAGCFAFTVGKKLWMEMRIAQDSHTDSEGTAFMGFAQQGLLSTGALLAANEAGMADVDYVGFQRIYEDGDKLDTMYTTSSTADDTVGADAVTVVAETYQKLGIYCDGTTVFFYADGVLLADSVLLSDSNFPTDEEMALYIGVMGGVDADDVATHVDWVRVAQEY